MPPSVLSLKAVLAAAVVAMLSLSGGGDGSSARGRAVIQTLAAEERPAPKAILLAQAATESDKPAVAAAKDDPAPAVAERRYEFPKDVQFSVIEGITRLIREQSPPGFEPTMAFRSTAEGGAILVETTDAVHKAVLVRYGGLFTKPQTKAAGSKLTPPADAKEAKPGSTAAASSPADRDTSPTRPQYDSRLAEALESDTSVEFEQNRLDVAVDYVSDLHQIPIQLDLRRLEEDGISPEQEFSLEMSDVPLRAVLTQILAEEIGGLDYYTRDGVLHVTTEAAAGENRTTRAYPIPEGMIASDVSEMITTHSLTSPRGDILFDVMGGKGVATAVGQFVVVTHSDRGHEAVGNFLDALDGVTGEVVSPSGGMGFGSGGGGFGGGGFGGIPGGGGLGGGGGGGGGGLGGGGGGFG